MVRTVTVQTDGTKVIETEETATTERYQIRVASRISPATAYYGNYATQEEASKALAGMKNLNGVVHIIRKEHTQVIRNTTKEFIV